jgi:hypothetical protein
MAIDELVAETGYGPVRGSYDGPAGRTNFAAEGKPQGPAGEPEWTSYQQTDRACLIIDRHDDVVHDLDARIRAAWGTEMVSFR